MWIQALYDVITDEFQRMRAAGVKFTSVLLLLLARTTIETNDGLYNSAYVDPRDGKAIIDKIHPRWIQQTVDSNGIVLRRQMGKLMCSPKLQITSRRPWPTTWASYSVSVPVVIWTITPSRTWTGRTSSWAFAMGGHSVFVATTTSGLPMSSQEARGQRCSSV